MPLTKKEYRKLEQLLVDRARQFEKDGDRMLPLKYIIGQIMKFQDKYEGPELEEKVITKVESLMEEHGSVTKQIEALKENKEIIERIDKVVENKDTLPIIPSGKKKKKKKVAKKKVIKDVQAKNSSLMEKLAKNDSIEVKND